VRLLVFSSLFLNYVLVLVQLYVESTWDVLQLSRNTWVHWCGSGSGIQNLFYPGLSGKSAFVSFIYHYLSQLCICVGTAVRGVYVGRAAADEERLHAGESISAERQRPGQQRQGRH